MASVVRGAELGTLMFASRIVGNHGAMSLLLGAILLLIGFGTLFIAPWVGAGFLAVAIVLGLVGGGWMLKNADEVDEESSAEPPHMAGPGNPQSGVD